MKEEGKRKKVKQESNNNRLTRVGCVGYLIMVESRVIWKIESKKMTRPYHNLFHKIRSS